MSGLFENIKVGWLSAMIVAGMNWLILGAHIGLPLFAAYWVGGIAFGYIVDWHRANRRAGGS